MNAIAIPIEKENGALPADWDARVKLGRSYVRRVVLDFWELGRHLLETRDQYGKGLWGRYLVDIGVDDSSADHYMDVAYAYPAREALQESGHRTLKAALADVTRPKRPKRERKAALPPPAEPTRTAEAKISDLGGLHEDTGEGQPPFGPPDRSKAPESAAEWGPEAEDHRSPERAWRLLEELRRCPPEDWAEEVLDMAEQAMGTDWLRDQLRARCRETEPASEPSRVIDLQERRPRAIASGANGDDLAAALAELGYSDGDGVMNDMRRKGGTLKLTPTGQEELRAHVEGGALAEFGFRWKPAKGNKGGFYWTDYGGPAPSWTRSTGRSS
jgi:hypothetical protein